MINPYPIVQTAIDGVQTSAQTAGVAIRAHFGEQDLKVDVDPSRLHQIVTNLLTNAVNLSKAGSEVEVLAGREDEHFRVCVTDYGRGIEAQYLPRIFERFSQQDATTTRSHGGLGLGLAIVKQLTELLGGSIEAASEGVDKGGALPSNCR